MATALTLAPVSVEIPEDKSDRFYASESYLLPSDEAEKARLDAQHFAVKPLSGGLIPVGVVLKEGDAVLDAGTGSGIWLLDLANDLPAGVSLVGVDIQGRLFPKPAPNMNFFVGSTFDLPHELDGSFSLVHQRLMVAAFSEDGWKQAIAGFFRVLKPGGYLKLEEVDFAGVFRNGSKVPPLTHKFHEATKIICKRRGVGPDTLLHIAEFLEEAGFELVEEVRKITRLGEEVAVRNAWIGAWRGMKRPYVDSGVLNGVSTDEDYDKFMDGIEEEWRSTNCGRTWCSWTARKPL